MTIPVSAELAPVARDQRIETLDILRAVALFGVLLMNIEYFTAPLETIREVAPGLRGLDYAIAWSQYVFMDGKFWTMFALLFGMGFAVMQERAAQAGREFIAPYLRRTAVLFIIGATHAVLVWGGDILHTYAIAAVVLLAILRGRWRWLLLPTATFLAAFLMHGGRVYLAGVVAFALFAAVGAWQRGAFPGRLWRSGVLLYCSVSVVILATTLVGALSEASSAQHNAGTARAIAETQPGIDRAASINASGSYTENVALRLNYLAENLFFGEIYLLVYVVGVFILGVWFMRAGLLRDVAANRFLFRRLAWFGIPSGVVLALCSAAITMSYRQPVAEFTIASHLMMLANLPLSLGYVAAIVLWVNPQRGATRLRWLAPAGRMALSHYLMQSVIATLLFYGYGLGLRGRIDRLGQLLLVVGLFSVQLGLSHWWLARFHYGPAEWLWRAFTYGHYAPFVRRQLAMPQPTQRLPGTQPAAD